MRLRPEEYDLLQRAVAAGGRLTVEGLPLADMVATANAAFTLQHLGVATAFVSFDKDMPVAVVVGLTTSGRTLRRPGEGLEK